MGKEDRAGVSGDAPSEDPGSVDAAMLHAWSDGDEAAGNRLVARHFDALYGFFRSKLAGEIDDLIQRTFLACVAQRRRLRDGNSFRAYLFAVARNELFDELRRRLSRPPPSLGESVIDALPDVGGVPTPSTHLSNRAEHILLLRGLRRLPLDDQIAIELFYWQGLSAAEVGEVLEVAASTIRTRLARARTKLEGIIADLTEDARLVESTVDGFEQWSASLRLQR